MSDLKQRVAGIRSSISDGREELVQGSRRKIANAATKLFRKKGFHKTAIRDIAVEMGVSQGHIYQYISKKEDILLLMLEMAVDDYNERLFCLADTDEPPEALLRRAMQTYYTIIDRHRDKTTVLYNHTTSLDTRDRRLLDQVEVDVTRFFTALVERGVVAGNFATKDPFVVAFDIVSLGHMWALKHHRFKGVMDLDAYITRQTDVILRALRPLT